jgi:D-arabinose 1-dehydrogenase-like Zn-dependent alcohol dehydrogenase
MYSLPPTERFSGSAIGNRRETIEALDFAARNLVKCHYKLEKMGNLSQVCIISSPTKLKSN